MDDLKRRLTIAKPNIHMSVTPGWLTQSLHQAQTFLGNLVGGDDEAATRSLDGSRPLTAVELTEHPEFPHVNWKLQPNQAGKIDVAAGRGGPFKLAYEIHGHGPNKLIVRAIPEIAVSCEWSNTR
jgi:hypothetical protein